MNMFVWLHVYNFSAMLLRWFWVLVVLEKTTRDQPLGDAPDHLAPCSFPPALPCISTP
jgi:hypothetical protein